MPCRFVILLHVVPGDSDRQDHWDLMLECPEFHTSADPDQDRVLKTWELVSEPGPGTTIRSKQLTDHRRVYLNFEGQLSHGRGEVRRQFGGDLEWITDDPDFKRVKLFGPDFFWLLSIQRVRGDEFMIEFTDVNPNSHSQGR